MEEEKLTPEYYELIYHQLFAIKIKDQAPSAGQGRIRIDVLKMDVKILKAFCFFLETWNYTSTTDVDIMEKLRSVWPKGYKLFDRMAKTRPIDKRIQDIDSVMFKFESKILQSKQHIEGWCRYSIHSKSSMPIECKSLSYSQILDVLKELLKNLFFLSGKIVRLKKQIDILRAKILFLLPKLIQVKHCPEGKEIIQFLNFIGDFAKSVTCLTCLYWAKEDSDEIASEMNIVCFDMLQKFIHYAYDITPLFISILKAYDLQPELVSDSFLLREAVEDFVDFFFEHLAMVLNDEFLILRDHVIFLITFLIDPPCENVGDLIRSQIYAIFHEDVYLLLFFDEMNEDFSDKKALLNGCMNRIDIAKAKIRQLYCGSSDSWITLEVGKIESNYFVYVHKELCWIEKHTDMEQVQVHRMGLRFLRVFLLCFMTWDDSDEEIRVKLNSMVISFRRIWGEKEEDGLLGHRLRAIRTGSIIDWHPLAFELQGKIQQSKLEAEAWCIDLFHRSFQFKTSTSYKILEFMDSIISNLNDLVSYRANKIVPFKKQIEILEEKLLFLRSLLKLGVNYEELGEFKVFVQAFANDAACLTFLYWAKDADAQTVSETNSMLSHTLQKIKPSTPDVSRLYFGVLMSAYVQRSDSHIFGQTAFSFVDFFLEDPVPHLKNDFQILQDNIVFLLTFLNDPPNHNVVELICSQIDVLFWESLYDLLPFDDKECDFSAKKYLLSDFMVRIEAINSDIRHNCSKFPDSALYNFPQIVSPHFLDFVIRNLRNLKDRMISDENMHLLQNTGS